MVRSSGYRLSRAAEADLEAIYAYTVETWSLAQADRYLALIETALEELAEGRRRGRSRDDLAAEHLLLSVGSHLVVYRQTEPLLVVRILHSSMDAPRHLP